MAIYVVIGKEKIKTEVVTSFKDRMKGFRFQFETIKTGLCYPKKKGINTYFLCQPIDIVITDKNDTILALYQNMRSEKFVLPKRKAYYIYELPAMTTKDLAIGETLTIRNK